MKRAALFVCLFSLAAAPAAAVELSADGPRSLSAARTIAAALRAKGMRDLSLSVRTRRSRGEWRLTVRIVAPRSGRVIMAEQFPLRWGRVTRDLARRIATKVEQRLSRRIVRNRRGDKSPTQRVRPNRNRPQRASRDNTGEPFGIKAQESLQDPAQGEPQTSIGFTVAGVPLRVANGRGATRQESTPGPPSNAANRGDIDQEADDDSESYQAPQSAPSVIYEPPERIGTSEVIHVGNDKDGLLRSVRERQSRAVTRNDYAFDSETPPNLAVTGDEAPELATREAASPSAAAREAIVDLGVGMGLSWSRYQFSGAYEAAYSSGAYSELQASGQFYPLRLIDDAAISQLGLSLSYARSLGLVTETAEAEVSTAITRMRGGLVYRISRGDHWYVPEVELLLGSGYTRLAFGDTAGPLENISLLDLGGSAALRFYLHSYAVILLGAGYRTLLSGQSPLFAAHPANAFSAHGFQFEGGVEGTFVYGIGYRLLAQFDRMGGLLSSTVTDQGALGLYRRVLSFGLSLTYRFES